MHFVSSIMTLTAATQNYYYYYCCNIYETTLKCILSIWSVMGMNWIEQVSGRLFCEAHKSEHLIIPQRRSYSLFVGEPDLCDGGILQCILLLLVSVYSTFSLSYL
jgi:hypothetical protein